MPEGRTPLDSLLKRCEKISKGRPSSSESVTAHDGGINRIDAAYSIRLEISRRSIRRALRLRTRSETLTISSIAI